MSLKNLAPKTKGILALSATGAIAVIAIIIYTIYVNKYLAITMRLQRLVGDVVLYDDGGSEQALKEKMRLQSGQSITTAGESLIMVSLDDTKLLTMEESSLAEIRTKRKHLEFHLLEGNLFFNVTKKLADNESFDIETATMVCGIRGTSAYVGRDSSRHEILMVTDGVVHVVATNPRTLEVTETDVYAGEMITVYLDEEAEGNATISLYKRKFREEDLPALALDTIAKNDELQRRIVDACGFDPEKLDALAEVSTVRGVSMYGDAARELYDMGKEDSIPLMGYRATEMITAANSACDIAVDDLPLEIAIIRGLRDVLDVGIDANYDEVPLNTLMTSAEDSYREIYSTLESAGVSGDDAINVVNVVSETLRESAIQMTSSGLTVEEVKEVFDATSYLFNEAITGAAAEAGESFSSVSEAISAAVPETKEYVTGTVTSEMIKDSNGEETVIALLRRPAAQQTPDDTEVENPDVTDPDVDDADEDEDADDADNANGAGNGNAGPDNAGNAGNDGAGNAGAGNDDAGNKGADEGAAGANGNDAGNGSSNSSGSSSSNSSSSSSSSGNASGNSSGNTTPQVTHSVSLVIASDETIVSGNITSYVEGQDYTLPTNVTKTPTAYIQYVFEGWYTSQTGGNPITGIDSSATNDIVLYARFTEAAREYNVTLVTDGGTIAGGPITGYSYDAAKYVSLPSANEMSKDPDANCTYTFEGWYTAQTGGVEVTRIAEGETGDKTYYAHWIQSPRTYTISRSSTVHGTMLVSDGNTSPTQATVGQTITVTLNPDNNYVVDALTVTKSSGGTVSTSLTGQSSDSKTYSFTMPADGVALSATFIGKEFDITTWHTAADTTMGTVQVLVGGTAVTKARYGESVTVTMTPATGYALDTTNAEYNRIQYYSGGWQGISSSNLLQSGTNTFTMPAGQVRLNAKFKLDNTAYFPKPNYGNTYATHSTTTVNTVSSEPNLNVAPGGTITLDLRPNNGYTLTQLRVFTGTIGTPNNTYLESSITFTENTANRYYSATFTMPDHNVTIIPTYSQVTANIAVSDTHLSTDVQTAKKDDTVTITATPETGYELDTVTVTRADNQTVTVSGTGNTRTFTMPGQTVTVSATYKLIDYNVSVATGITNGTVSAGVTTANYGDTVTVTATPSTGYEVDTLTYTPAGGSATAITQTNGVYSFTMPASDVTINGTFAQASTTGDLYCEYDDSTNTVHVYASNDAGNTRTVVSMPCDMMAEIPSGKVISEVAFEEDIYPTDTSGWFSQMTDLTDITGMSHLHTENVTRMDSMFYECNVLDNLDLSGFVTSNVEYMYYMFEACNAIDTLDLSGFDTSSVTDMSCMFENCGVQSLDVSSFDTSSVTGMQSMFYGCSRLTTLDLTSFDTSSVGDMRNMFEGCTLLTTITVSADFTVASGTPTDNMFDDCDVLAGSNGTTYSNEYINGNYATHTPGFYARVDGGSSAPGFFSGSGSSSNTGVSFATMTNGSVSANNTTPSAGDTVTLTVTPTAGYKLDTLTVTGSSGAVTTTTVTTGVVYRFTMPSTGVTVNATFVADNTNRSVSVLGTNYDKGDVTKSSGPYTSGTVVTLTVNNLVSGYTPEITVSDGMNSNIKVPVTAVDSTHFTFVMPAFSVQVRTKYIGPYNVNIGTLTNGSVTSIYASAIENEEVIISAHPATGYEVDTVTVTQSDGTAVSVSAVSGDSNAANGYFNYSFDMPASDVSVDVTFKVATTQYSITVHQPSGATLTADYTSATPGTLITVTTDPSITVNYVYYVVDSSDHYIYNAPYTFRMPYGNVDIYCDY